MGENDNCGEVRIGPGEAEPSTETASQRSRSDSGLVEFSLECTSCFSDCLTIVLRCLEESTLMQAGDLSCCSARLKVSTKSGQCMSLQHLILHGPRLQPGGHTGTTVRQRIVPHTERIRRLLAYLAEEALRASTRALAL